MSRVPVNEALLAQWLATEPACVQALAAEFPAGSILQVHGEPRFVVGYSREAPDTCDTLILSELNPADGYSAALAVREYAHAHHFRGQQ